MRTFGIKMLPVFAAMMCASAHSFGQDSAPSPSATTSSSAPEALPAPPPPPPVQAPPTPLPVSPDQPASSPPLPPPPLPPTPPVASTPPLPVPIPGSMPPAMSPNVAPVRSPSISGPGAGPAMVESVQQWYGWQTLLAATPANIACLLGLLEGDTGFPMAAYPLNLFVGPMVHWTHGHAGRGFAAFGLNLSVPLLLAVAGTAVDGTSEYGGIIGMNLGIATAQLIDTLGWSRETVRVPIKQPKGTQALLPSSVGFLPMMQSTQKGIMLVGQF